jgi:hypothetical protein
MEIPGLISLIRSFQCQEKSSVASEILATRMPPTLVKLHIVSTKYEQMQSQKTDTFSNDNNAMY